MLIQFNYTTQDGGEARFLALPESERQSMALEFYTHFQEISVSDSEQGQKFTFKLHLPQNSTACPKR